MDYFAIVKKAFHLSIKNKFLWIFGILAGGAAGVGSFNTDSMQGVSTGQSGASQWTSHLNDFDWTVFWDKFGVAVLILMAVFFIISITLFVLNIVSQGALVNGVDKLSKDEKTNFYDNFHAGWHQFWRIWGTGLIFLFLILGSLIVLIVPVCILVILEAYIIAIILGILLLIACIFFWLIISFVSPYALRTVVLKKLSIVKSIRSALHLVRNNWVDVLVMYIILIAIGIIFSIAIVLTLLLGGAILAIIGYGLYLASPVAMIIYAIVVGLAILAGLVVVYGAYSSFTSGVVTLTYLNLKHSDD